MNNISELLNKLLMPMLAHKIISKKEFDLLYDYYCTGEVVKQNKQNNTGTNQTELDVKAAQEKVISAINKMLEEKLDNEVRNAEIDALFAKLKPMNETIKVTLESREKITIPRLYSSYTPLIPQLLTNMDISVRALNCMYSAGIIDIVQLYNTPKSELMKIKNFGKTTLVEIENLFKGLGIDY